MNSKPTIKNIEVTIHKDVLYQAGILPSPIL